MIVEKNYTPNEDQIFFILPPECNTMELVEHFGKMVSASRSPSFFMQYKSSRILKYTYVQLCIIKITQTKEEGETIDSAYHY